MAFAILLTTSAVIVEAKWRLHPVIQGALDQIKVGEITSIRGSDRVIGTVDEQTREDYLKAQKANDKEGIDELKAADRIALIPPGVDLRVLERNENELDRMTDTVHKLLDIDINSYKQCMNRNIRRTEAGLRLEACTFNFDDAYNLHTAQCLNGATPGDFIDSHVMVLVRVLNQKEASRKLWVLYSNLNRPSRPDLP